MTVIEISGVKQERELNGHISRGGAMIKCQEFNLLACKIKPGAKAGGGGFFLLILFIHRSGIGIRGTDRWMPKTKRSAKGRLLGYL